MYIDSLGEELSVTAYPEYTAKVKLCFFSGLILFKLEYELVLMAKVIFIE